MAKKKTAETANIKAGPVLRVENPGVEPTPDPEERTITKSYAVRDEWKDRDITNFVFFKSVDGKITDLLVNGEPAGGGGGGTATVTLTNNTSNKGVTVYGPALINNVYTYSNSLDDALVVEKGDTVTLTIFMGSSGANLYMGGITSVNDMVMTGAISYDSDLMGFIVRGDGTITI